MDASTERTEDDDLKLVKASGGLLAELEDALPKVLWRDRGQGQHPPPRAHVSVRRHDLERVIALVEPFQGEPQLLDAKLKTLLPTIIDAYIWQLGSSKRSRKPEHIDLQSAVCKLLYTFCKVRGQKVVVGFFNNEPRYLEPVLEALERTWAEPSSEEITWQMPYVLLLWLSHLLLTPFDLTSISTKAATTVVQGDLTSLPPLTARVLHVGLAFLGTPNKAQDAAAALLCRLCARPDVQSQRLAETLVRSQLTTIEAPDLGTQANMYGSLGALRLLAGTTAAAELGHLAPDIYRSCTALFCAEVSSGVPSNAVAKKLAVKIFRNVALLALRSTTSQGPLSSFLETTPVLEEVIDFLLRSLGDQDTPVRHASAKAISLIILNLEVDMGYEVVQAVLDMFKEDIPKSAGAANFTTANPLKWHGLTLTLAQILFQRSAAPAQLPDILNALLAALQFRQRTATGTILGANVRDAANFGIWSLARRYTTAELLSSDVRDLHAHGSIKPQTFVVQLLATELILSACTDPAGNIRRGSSAALQELVGRHPDQVKEGIALVQIVDYQAVGLRNRAMTKVACESASLCESYWIALLDSLLSWRGIGSADATSRASAATSIASLAVARTPADFTSATEKVVVVIRQQPLSELETMHGCVLALSRIANEATTASSSVKESAYSSWPQFWTLLELLRNALTHFSPRMLRSELPASIAKYITAVCNMTEELTERAEDLRFGDIDTLVDLILSRHEDWLLETVPNLVQSVFGLKRKVKAPLTCIGMKTLANAIRREGVKSTVQGGGRAMALGCLLPFYEPTGLDSDYAATAVACLEGLMGAMNVNWRIVGAQALQLLVANTQETSIVNVDTAEQVCRAVHRGLIDYTIDERGDIGSLVRLQSLTCASGILGRAGFLTHIEATQVLEADIYRLSLEKLDRVRLQAALCRQEYLLAWAGTIDIPAVCSSGFFEAALQPLVDSPDWMSTALLEGCISCAGAGAEAVLVASRRALGAHLTTIDTPRLEHLLSVYMTVLKAQLNKDSNTYPTLELLAFLLDMQIPQRLQSSSTFKWRNLLSLVQKSHHKSNDLLKILAAVQVYRGLSEVPAIAAEVLKKLISMLKTNPYPRVRAAVAEVTWIITREETMKSVNWTQPIARIGNDVIERLRTTEHLN